MATNTMLLAITDATTMPMIVTGSRARGDGGSAVVVAAGGTGNGPGNHCMHKVSMRVTQSATNASAIGKKGKVVEGTCKPFFSSLTCAKKP